MRSNGNIMPPHAWALFHEMMTLACADRIRQMRAHRGYTQKYVSESIGMHRPIYARVERGRHLVSLDTLLRLAEVFEVSAADMLPGGAVTAVDVEASPAEGRRLRGGRPCARAALESRQRS